MSRDARELATDLQCYADVCERAINEGFESMRRLIPNPERLRAAAALLAQSKAAPQEQLTQLTSGSIAKTTPAIPASAAPASGEGAVEESYASRSRGRGVTPIIPHVEGSTPETDEVFNRHPSFWNTEQLEHARSLERRLRSYALSLREQREGMPKEPHSVKVMRRAEAGMGSRYRQLLHDDCG